MKGLWLQNQTLVYREDIDEPIAKKGEALIRVRLAGVCSTDLEMVQGYYSFTGVPGHEFVGEVVNAPSNESWAGKRVVGEINIACGECETCLKGLPRHCERRKTLGIHDWNGVFAEYLVLPLDNLHELPVQIPDRSAVFTEPLAAAYEIIDQQLANPGDEVLVIGAGRLGQLIAQVLNAFGVSPYVLARHDHQRELLASSNIQAISESQLAWKKYDAVIEATGSPEGFFLARQAVRPRGIIILKSTYKGDISVNLSSVVVDEVRLAGSRCGPFEPALSLIEEGKVNPEGLIDEIFPLSRGVQAFSRAAIPGVLKVLVQPGP